MMRLLSRLCNSPDEGDRPASLRTNRWLKSRNLATLQEAIRDGCLEPGVLNVNKYGMVKMVEGPENRRSRKHKPECPPKRAAVPPRKSQPRTTDDRGMRKKKAHLRSLLSTSRSIPRLPLPLEEAKRRLTARTTSRGLESWFKTLDELLRPYLLNLFQLTCIAHYLQQGAPLRDIKDVYAMLRDMDGVKKGDEEEDFSDLSSGLATTALMLESRDKERLVLAGARLQQYLRPRRDLAEALIGFDVELRKELKKPWEEFRRKTDLAFKRNGDGDGDGSDEDEVVRHTFEATVLVKDMDDVKGAVGEHG